jgi:predicted PurR-regulated permease PerM
MNSSTPRAVGILVLLLGFCFVIYPLGAPVLMGGVFAALLWPGVVALEGKGLRRSIAAALITLGLTLLFLIPASFLVFIAVKAVSKQLAGLKELPAGESVVDGWVHSPQVEAWLARASEWFSVPTEDVIQTLRDLARSLGLRLADSLGDFLTGLPGLTLSALIMVISVYFFLQGADQLARTLRKLSVFRPGETDRLMSSFTGLCRSVLLAAFLSGLAQCLFFTLGLVIAGHEQTGLVALLVLLTSFLPLVGSAPITFGATVHAFLRGEQTEGFILLVFALLAGIVDNFVRPAVLRGSANLHPLIAFLSAFGGLQVFGFAGIFLGPIVAGVALSLLEEWS